MPNPAIKPIKVLSDIVLKQSSEAKKGLIVSGTIGDSPDVGLAVENHVHLSRNLQVNGNFQLSGSSDFLTINDKSPRNGDGLYLVDNAIHALDEKLNSFSTTLNSNKYRFDSNPTIEGIQEHTSSFPWSSAGNVSLDIMIYNPVDETWSNDLTSVKMTKNISNNTIKFLVTTPKLGDPDVDPAMIIRVIATKETSIL